MEPVSFSKGPFCGHCKKSENCDLMSCSRCRLAKYCSMDCQKNDFSNHKNDCQWVGHFQEMMPKIEKLYSNWDGGENIFETQGEYSAWKANLFRSLNYSWDQNNSLPKFIFFQNKSMNIILPFLVGEVSAFVGKVLNFF